MGIDTISVWPLPNRKSARDEYPLKGKVFISVMNKDKRSIVFVAKKLVDLGFEIAATKGTAKVLLNNAIPVQTV